MPRYKKNYRIDGWPIEDTETSRVLHTDDLLALLNDAQQGEAVGTVTPPELHGRNFVRWHTPDQLPVGTKLYTHPPAKVPEGYVLVPVEPTEAMLDAANNCHTEMVYPQDAVVGPRAMRRAEYKAMLKAAQGEQNADS